MVVVLDSFFKKKGISNIYEYEYDLQNFTVARQFTYIHWTKKMTQRLFIRPTTLIPIKLSRPDPKRVDTWQPPRAFEWVPVSQGPSRDSQGIWYPNLFKKKITTRLYKNVYTLRFLSKIRQNSD